MHLVGKYPEFCQLLAEVPNPDFPDYKADKFKFEKSDKDNDAKLKQLSTLLDFSIMAEGFENLLGSKKTDSLLI